MRKGRDGAESLCGLCVSFASFALNLLLALALLAPFFARPADAACSGVVAGEAPRLVVSRADLPSEPEIIVLPGR